MPSCQKICKEELMLMLFKVNENQTRLNDCITFNKNAIMKFLSLQPFVPSGKDFDSSRQFFIALGFTINWDAGDYIGFVKDECKFILQKFDNKEFAENLMITVGVEDVSQFRQEILDKKILEKFPVRVGEVTQQAYGKEVNLIDIAGVCWHFVSA
jgi:predicted lactoylglutathione lyase